MILNFEFMSSNHLLYENGVQVSNPHCGAKRLVKVEPNRNGSSGYSVSTYNFEGNHPNLQNNILMAHKQMKVVEETADKIVLCGYGQDQMGTSVADCGMTIFLENGTIAKCKLHMYDKGVDIEYLL